MKTLVLFDFDNTITKEDTFLDFLRYYRGCLLFYAVQLFLFPLVILYFVGIIDNGSLKLIFFNIYLGKISEEKYVKITKEYVNRRLPRLIKCEALERIRWHLKKGHEIVVVSASEKKWVDPWCLEHKISSICTELEFENGHFTGRFASPNCFGETKAALIKQHYNLKSYKKIYAYGDSASDGQMLALATEKFFRRLW